jgi:hypothetical protein
MTEPLVDIGQLIPTAQLIDPPEGGEIQASGGSPLRVIGRTFIENRLAVVGVFMVVGLVLFSFIGPLLYHTNQTVPNLINVNLGPGSGRPIGTDDNGFDILGRLMVGGRISLEVAFATAIVTMVVGVLWGAVAGFFGGPADSVMMRFVDILLAIPAIYLYLDIQGIFKTTEFLLILILAGLSWLGPSRLVRGEVLSLRSREYVQAVTVMGGKPSRIILRHRHHRRADDFHHRRRHLLPHRPRVHRPRIAYHHADLGRDARWRHQLPAGRVLVAALSRAADHRHCHRGVQSDR